MSSILLYKDDTIALYTAEYSSRVIVPSDDLGYIVYRLCTAPVNSRVILEDKSTGVGKEDGDMKSDAVTKGETTYEQGSQLTHHRGVADITKSV